MAVAADKVQVSTSIFKEKQKEVQKLAESHGWSFSKMLSVLVTEALYNRKPKSK